MKKGRQLAAYIFGAQRLTFVNLLVMCHLAEQ